MSKLAWVGVAIGVVAAVALPEIARRRTESRVRELVAAVNETGGSRWQASVASYDRTWLRSASVVRFRSADGGDLAEIHTAWTHAPLAGLGLAAGTSEVRLAGRVAEFARQSIGAETVATVQHTAGFDGSVRGDIVSPAFERTVMDGVRVSGSGSSGTMTLDRAGRYALDHRYPKLAFAGGGNVLEVDGVSFTADGRIGSAALETPASYLLSVKAIRWTSDSGAMAIADPSLAFRMVPLGESLEFKFGHAVGPGRLETRGSTHRWNKIELQLTLSDISRAAIEGLSRDLRVASEQPESSPRRLELTLAAFSTASQALLKRDPALSLDPFTFDGPDGKLSITATARFDRARLADGGLGALPRAASVVARLSIARALARAWLGAALRTDGLAALTQPGERPPSAEDVDRWSRARADDVLDAAARAGLFREGADPIVVEIVARDGRVLANGFSAERLAELREALLPSRRPSRALPQAPGGR